MKAITGALLHMKPH